MPAAVLVGIFALLVTGGLGWGLTAQIAAIRKYADAGYDHVCVHQVGKEQKGFFEFYADEILPELRTLRAPRGERRGNARRRRKS